MVIKTQAIQRFLEAKAVSGLGSLYTPNMECQVNVAADGGEPVTNEYRGRKWTGYTDGVTTWKSFRIPYNAATDPEYRDTGMSFDLERHAEAVGMTGWDWVDLQSRWVAFDFDDIATHGSKRALSADEMQELVDVASEVKWVTIRKSTSGRGLHLYVFINESPVIKNHTEHAALARAVLGKLSAVTGYDFSSRVDVCGSNMWVWHRKTGNSDGLTIIKEGSPLEDIPINWRDHLNVVTSKTRKIRPTAIDENNTQGSFAELCGQRPRVKLDDQHKALIKYLEENDCTWWWDNDNWMLVTHTLHLKSAFTDLGLRGFFDTTSSHSSPHNCFAFPMKDGAWSVRRYTIGVDEHTSWSQDPNGWTGCYYNRVPTFESACRSFEGIEDPSGGFVFRDGAAASEAARLLGVDLNLPMPQVGRRCRIKQHKDGRLIVEIDYDSMDRSDNMRAWLQKNKIWTRMFNTKMPDPTEPELSTYDDLVRHMVTESGEDYGWVIRSDDTWKHEPLTHIRIALTGLGLNSRDSQVVLGSSVFKCWTIVNKPFEEEYPGNREWNRNAATFRYKPTQNLDNLVTPYWDSILSHIGESLDEALRENAWAKANGIRRGADYLRCWIASLLQKPLEPLPFLFLYGPQNSGKSIMHEAISLLLTKGYCKADQALTSQSGFNGELAGMILCVIEEVDIGRSKTAYNRIKDWVTAREMSIHEKNQTPYHIPNSTHWIQIANDHSYCPVFPGDTRIVTCYVPDINPLDLVPKGLLIRKLEEEASDFLAQMLSLEIPESNDRLGLPVITTEDKSVMQQMNRAPLHQFIAEKIKNVDGYWIKFSEFYDQLQKWLDPDDFVKHTKQFVGKNLPPQFPKGRNPRDSQFYIGNMAWINQDTEEKKPRYILRGANLVPREANDAQPTDGKVGGDQ
jgi:hypothetical protein